MSQQPDGVAVLSGGRLLLLSFADAVFTAIRPPSAPGTSPLPHCTCSVHHVLNVTYSPHSQSLSVSCLSRKKDKAPLSLTIIEGKVTNSEHISVQDWVSSLLAEAYKDTNQGRKIKVIVNPHGGTGKGTELYQKTIKPIFDAAGCSVDVTYTTHGGHAKEIGRNLSLEYDAVASVSGDGLIHELLNGFKDHNDPIRAFSTPLAPIPAGSGNGLSLNLLGLEDGFDVAAATLNVIKGLPMKVDLFSITQGGKRSLSYMSQAVGLMADLDLGTENLRWMGDTRFTVGLARGILGFKSCPVELSYKAVEVDKMSMVQTFRTRRNESIKNLPSPSIEVSQEQQPLPPLIYSSSDPEGWTTFEKAILYVYAGKGPYVSRSMMAFPMSLPNDGLIDILVQPASSRRDILKSLEGSTKGQFFWRPTVHYIKARAYRIKPLSSKGNLSIDGEHFPFEEFQVECHSGIGTFLSPFGHYAADFQAQPKKK